MLQNYQGKYFSESFSRRFVFCTHQHTAGQIEETQILMLTELQKKLLKSIILPQPLSVYVSCFFN